MPTPIERDQVQPLLQQGARLVEVLPPDEYEDEHLPGAINIPLKTIDRETTRQLDRSRSSSRSPASTSSQSSLASPIRSITARLRHMALSRCSESRPVSARQSGSRSSAATSIGPRRSFASADRSSMGG
jgi:rhodanese-related sulfurtransferase